MDEFKPTQGEQKHTSDSDSRKFRFALVCFNCDFKCNNLKDLKCHLKQDCPYGPPYNLLCGHCEFRTHSWAKLVFHLNKQDLHQAPPKRPWLEFVESPAPSAAAASLPQIHVTKPPPLKPVVCAPASVFVPPPLGPPSDVEPDDPLPPLPLPPRSPSSLLPPLLREGAVDTSIPPFIHQRMMTPSPPQPSVSSSLPESTQIVTSSKSTITTPFPLLSKALQAQSPNIAMAQPIPSAITRFIRPVLSMPESLSDVNEQPQEGPPPTALVLEQDVGTWQLSDNHPLTTPVVTASAHTSSDETPLKTIKIEPPDTILLSSSDSGTEAAKPVTIKTESKPCPHSRQKEKDKLRLIIHLADTIAQVAASRHITKSARRERAYLLDRGLWPPTLALDAKPDEISLRLGDYFRGRLSSLEED